MKELINRIKSRFIELWQYRVFKSALVIHVIYFILSNILFFTVFYEQNDFIAFYSAGRILIEDITNLYSQVNMQIHFRYFPISAIFYIPFCLYGFNLGYIIFNLFNFFLTILTCIVLYRIIIIIRRDDHEKDDKRVITYISIFLIGLPHIDNYVLGQINQYIILLILIALYVFLKKDGIKWQIIGSFIIGISINIKPITIFIIPFLMLINYNIKERKLFIDLKNTTIRILGVIIPVSLNLIFFIIYPSLLDGFINNNFGGNRTLEINFSFSVTKLIINFCTFFNIPYNYNLIFLLVTFLIGGFGILIYILGNPERDLIIYGFTIGMIIPLLVYYDSWDHHLLTITPLLIIILFNLPRNSNITKNYIKPSFFFFCFLDLAFMGIWYLTESWFPFNFGSTLFLILVLFGIGKYSLIN